MHPNPQAAAWLNDESRPALKRFSKSDAAKESPARKPRDRSQEGMEHEDEHEQAHAEHGPVMHSHIEHDHEAGIHTVHLHHEDGHKRTSTHDSVKEATDHVNAAHITMPEEEHAEEEIHPGIHEEVESKLGGKIEHSY
jgi:hypothetical protein